MCVMFKQHLLIRSRATILSPLTTTLLFIYFFFSPIPVAVDGYQYKADNQLDCLSQLGLLNMPYVFLKKIYAYSFSLNLKH